MRCRSWSPTTWAHRWSTCSSGWGSPSVFARASGPRMLCSRHHPILDPTVIRDRELREQALHREISLAGVEAESEDTGPILHRRDLLSDGGERRAGRDADENAFLPRAASCVFGRVLRGDLDHPVEQLEPHHAGDEAGSDALDGMR